MKNIEILKKQPNDHFIYAMQKVNIEEFAKFNHLLSNRELEQLKIEAENAIIERFNKANYNLTFISSSDLHGFYFMPASQEEQKNFTIESFKLYCVAFKYKLDFKTKAKKHIPIIIYEDKNENLYIDKNIFIDSKETQDKIFILEILK